MRQYFIYILYHDAIEPERMGYFRTHLWTVLHFPFHVALLLTVEGSASLIVWNISKNFALKWSSQFDNLGNVTFTSNDDLCKYLIKGIDVLDEGLRSNVSSSYNYQAELQEIGRLNFSASTWDDNAYTLVNKIYVEVENVLFESFGVHGAEPKDKSKVPSGDRLTALILIQVDTAFLSFYIAAGLFLMFLAALFWLGKRNKSVGEWASIALRVFVGIGVTLTILADYVQPISSEHFFLSVWIIPVVTLGYFLGKGRPCVKIEKTLTLLSVIAVDNMLVWSCNRKITPKGGPSYRLCQETRDDSEKLASPKTSADDSTLPRAS